ncbi:MAG: small-conductance mechanosensitive channel [Rhodothermales bacterium]|jgi:small-conductance mechanosensitive channel
MSETIAGIIDSDLLFNSLRAGLIAILGFVFLRYFSRFIVRLIGDSFSQQIRMIVDKMIVYLGTLLILLVVMHNLGFKLTALLGTAGILGVAIGFASQTSLSNVISGLFMMGEKAFEAGDLIQVGELSGYVMSIDLLSVKLRTLDNKLVRVPNESLLKESVVNFTRFSIRRWDNTIGVAYKEDITHVIAVIRDVVDKNRFCLDEPEPVIFLANFADSACEIFVGVWFERVNFLEIRASFLPDIKARFDAEGIEIPFPHRTIYTGSATTPMPLRLVEAGDSPQVPPI